MTGRGRPVAPRWARRRRAREAALRLLYRCEVGRLDEAGDVTALDGVYDEEEGGPLDGEEQRLAAALARGAWEARAALDARIAAAADNWRVERLAAVDRQILRLATHELLAWPETPPGVVLDEAIELARIYSGEEAARFVNGVLDAILRALRREGRVRDRP